MIRSITLTPVTEVTEGTLIDLSEDEYTSDLEFEDLDIEQPFEVVDFEHSDDEVILFNSDDAQVTFPVGHLCRVIND